MSISNEVRVDDETGASPADPGRRRSPVRRVVIVVVAMVAVAALAAAGVWATTPRLDHSGSVWGSLYEDTARFPAENLAVVVTDPTGPDDTAYAWDIRNDGPFPVTVASKVAAGEIHDLRRAGVLLTRVAPEGGTVTTGEPVRSLRLEPGERVKIEARPMWACGSSDGSVMYSAGVAEGISTIDVDVTTLGVTRTQTLQIPQTLFLMTTADLSPGAAWGC
ncbi:hypothetical protein [Sanguibacter sp. HDW7]|uniref:hypothetical protein n=1 Tax=Sanguibacter sp. HDW7 TaxID=2714931 RepID=UPI001407A6A9|nr:hypothetical protein [Sanguibacter sp. HDW7]QIK82468.1 hypothetical protein G7063_01680 [Sanguibacter sp. HDW7]